MLVQDTVVHHNKERFAGKWNRECLIVFCFLIWKSFSGRLHEVLVWFYPFWGFEVKSNDHWFWPLKKDTFQKFAFVAILELFASFFQVLKGLCL